MKKSVMVFSATGVAGTACVDEMLRMGSYQVVILQRSSGQLEKTSYRPITDQDKKQAQLDKWLAQGVEIRTADATSVQALIPAMAGIDYLVSCAPMTATESQYPLIWAAKEAGVERFIPSEFGNIYEWEQYLPTDTIHRQVARQKVFIKRVIELAGLDYTIIPAGLWPEFFMLEPVAIIGDADARTAWSTGADLGRIIPHVLAHPASRNAVCPVAATAYCSWNELLDAREKTLGRKIERHSPSPEQWRAAYAQETNEAMKMVLGIGVAGTECPEGMPLSANWNGLHLPEFKGTPLATLFPEYIEPFVAALKSTLQADSEAQD